MSKLSMLLPHYEREVRAERGATAVEYALTVTLIAAVIIGTVIVFGAAVTNLFSVPFP